MNKNFLKSKTVWFNILTGLVVVATFFGYVPNESVSSTVSGALLALAPLVNIGIRFVTKTAVTLR